MSRMGCNPYMASRDADGMTLGIFIADTYTTWVNASRPRTASNTLEKLYRLFRAWYAEPLTAITVERIESWKARRLNEGRSPATVLRDLFTLSSVLRRAIRAGELSENPVRRIDKPRILLSMDTGLRRGEVLKLRWNAIDFSRRLLTVEGPNAKNRQTRHVPLNEEAINTLRRQQEREAIAL